jgi:hypothetical protein
MKPDRLALAPAAVWIAAGNLLLTAILLRGPTIGPDTGGAALSWSALVLGLCLVRVGFLRGNIRRRELVETGR